MKQHIFLTLDINECNHGLNSTDTDGCHDNATCTNTESSYTCECNTGYTGDGFNCSSMCLQSENITNRKNIRRTKLAKIRPGDEKFVLKKFLSFKSFVQ